LEDAVVVQGVNVMKRATKGKGFVEKTHPIHISNVAYYDTETSQVSKIAIVTDTKGNRKRQIKKTGRILTK
jgi:large subunit ribosomal protein L24